MKLKEMMFLLILLVVSSFWLGYLTKVEQVKEQAKEVEQYNLCKEYFSHAENWALPFPSYIEECLKVNKVK